MPTIHSRRHRVHSNYCLQACCGSELPPQTVKIIVPNPAGGTADALPRVVGDALSKVWKQAVVVENRPGAAGNVGAESFSRAAADGYTLLASPPTTLAINQSLYKTLNYDPTKFRPITVIGSSPNVLIVNAKLGVSTVRELIEKAKADPGGIAYGSQGIGATSHLTTALFETMAGVKFNHVAYRSKFQAYGAEPIGNSRKEAEAFIEKERILWGDVIEKAKLKAPE